MTSIPLKHLVGVRVVNVEVTQYTKLKNVLLADILIYSLIILKNGLLGNPSRYMAINDEIKRNITESNVRRLESRLKVSTVKQKECPKLRIVKYVGMALLYQNEYVGMLHPYGVIEVRDDELLPLVLQCQREAA